MTGLALYQVLYDSLDLPESLKDQKLTALLSQNNISPDELTIEKLREIVADLLHSLILESEQDSGPQ